MLWEVSVGWEVRFSQTGVRRKGPLSVEEGRGKGFEGVEEAFGVLNDDREYYSCSRWRSMAINNGVGRWDEVGFQRRDGPGSPDETCRTNACLLQGKFDFAWAVWALKP